MTTTSNTLRSENARKKLKLLGSPKEVQQRNLHTILIWLYRWGFSTPSMLSCLLGRKNRSHAKRLEAHGWIRMVTAKGYPTYCTLTEKGLSEAIRHSNALLEYKEIDPYRVHLPTVHHDLLAQAETLTALRTKRIYEYRTPRMFDYSSELAPRKIPDVIWVEDGVAVIDEKVEVFDILVAVEIELTPKWNHHLDSAITSIIDDIQNSLYQMCIYISDSNAILERYRTAFRPGIQVKIWNYRSQKGKPADSGETLKIPDWVHQRIEFRQAGSTTPYMKSMW